MGIRNAFVASFACLSVVVAPAQDGGTPTSLVQELAISPTPATGIDVLVVSEKGKPVKEPLVVVLPTIWTEPQQAKVAALLQAYQLRPNEALAAVAHAFGTAFRADAAGKVRVPADARRLVACDGTMVGETRLDDAPTGPVTVRLLGARAVWVRLRTADGKPVGDLPVQLGTGTWGRGNESTADARGDCILRLRLGERMQTGMWVEAMLAGARQRVDLPTPWPRTPIELEVAASGLLRVIVYDGKEQPRTDVQRVRLAWDGDLFGIVGKVEPSGATFRVATRMRYKVEVAFAGTGGAQEVPCVGPQRAGELVVCEVRGATGPPVVAIRVLGADGKPLARERVGLVVVTAKAVRGVEATTDAEGVMRHLADADWQDADEIYVLWRATAANASALRVGQAARCAPPAALQSGENRLPDVALQEEPFVVAGRVVDDAGTPLANLAVQLLPVWRRSSMGFSTSTITNRVTTDAFGRFRLHDLTVGDEVEVQVSAGKGFESTKAVFAKGTTDATVVVHRLGRVRVTLADVPADATRLLTAFLVGKDAAPEGDGQSLGADTFLSARAGNYDLVLRLPQANTDLFRIPGITLQAGTDSDEPRLLGLQWNGFAAAVRITAVTADERPAAEVPVMVSIREGRRSSGSGGRTGKDGTFFTLVPKGGADINVGGRSDPFSARAFRQVFLTNVTTDQRVVLRPRLVVHLQPKLDVVLPASAGAQWTVGADAGLAAMLRGTFGGARSLPGNVVEILLDAPGSCAVTMFVVETVDGRRVQHRFDWGKIDVHEADGVQSFAIELAPDDATRLAELRERLQAK